MTISQIRQPDKGYAHRDHRPKKNRKSGFILGNQMFGKKLKSKKARLEEIEAEEEKKDVELEEKFKGWRPTIKTK